MDLREDKTLTCRDCGSQLLFTVRDQQFYAEKGFTNTPARCPKCRAARRASHDGGRKRGKRMADVTPRHAAGHETGGEISPPD